MTIEPKHTKVIMAEMFRRVGLEYDEKFTQKPNWFMEKTWPSPQEEMDFTEWLADYLKMNKLGNFRRPLHEAMKLACDYGWKSAEGFLDYFREFKEGKGTRYVRING